MSIAVKSRDPTLEEGVKKDVFRICISSSLDFDHLISLFVQQAFTEHLICRRLVATNKRRSKIQQGISRSSAYQGTQMRKSVWIKATEESTGLLGSRVKNLPANAGDKGLTPRLGRVPKGGNGNPLQYSSLKNPMDRGARRATVYWVMKSWTQWSTRI